jgi:hypothetical protein
MHSSFPARLSGVSLLAALLCGSAPATAQQTLPFLATYTGPSNSIGPDASGNVIVTSTLRDPLASFGLTEALFSQTVFVFANPNTVVGTSIFQPTGGAGVDKLFTSYSGIGTAIDPAAGNFVTLISGVFTFTGGTGRFAGASGGGSWFGQANLATTAVSVTFQGNVTPVPEPSEWLAMGMAGTSVMGLMIRARRRRTGKSSTPAAAA